MRGRRGLGERFASGGSGPIKIGAILGISGRFAFVGEPQKQALELAQQRINADGGIAGRQVEFVIYDDEVDETKSVPLTNRLISEDKVVAIIGPSITVPALAIQPIVERAKMPNMTLTSKAIWEGKEDSFVFHTTPREEVEVKSILSFIKDELKTTKVGVIYDRQPYGTGTRVHQAVRAGVRAAGGRRRGHREQRHQRRRPGAAGPRRGRGERRGLGRRPRRRARWPRPSTRPAGPCR